MTPKKYKLLKNSYGNVESKNIPKGWINFEENKRSKHVRYALNSGRIYTYERMDGFNKTRGGWKPELTTIIHTDQLPLLARLIAKSKRESEKAKKKNAAKRKTKAYKEERAKAICDAEKKAVEAEKRRERLRRKAKQIGLPMDRYTILLIECLYNVDEANRNWLREAYRALRYSLENKGVMHFWQKSKGEMEFYHSLCLAIGAHRRHNNTDYEYLLRAGLSKEDARFLMERI